MEHDEARRHLLALCRIPGVSWDRIAREAQRPGGVERLLNGEITERAADAALTLERLRAAAHTLEERLAFVDTEFARASQAGARLITVLDDDYPKSLRSIRRLPPFLFVLGDIIAEDERAVAVVGTRAPSAEGIARAEAMARGLATHGITVVSGLARGIDTAAHAAALMAGGRSMAVMGTGILARYPRENGALADWIATRGALVSQFWPTAPPVRHNFPLRNAVISGISQGTVVVEASATSGARMQARLAIEQRRPVFLLHPLVNDQGWARRYLESRPHVFEAHTVDDVLRRLPSLAAPRVRGQDHQLSLDLA